MKKEKQIEINMTVVMTVDSNFQFDENDTNSIRTLFKLFHAGRTDIKDFNIVSIKN